MFRKLVDFFSSVGMILLGIILILVGSITIQKIKTHDPSISFPILSAWFGYHTTAATSTVSETLLPKSKPLLPLKKDTSEFTKPLSAAAVVVVDDQTDTVLWSRNSTEIRPLASISKLMSILVLNDLSLNMTTTTVIQSEDSDGTSSQVRLGEKYTLGNLWEAGLVGSSNIAIRSLVRAAGFSIPEFAERMNVKAEQLHLPTLHFVEPTGLSAENIGSAEDVAKLLQIVLENKKITQILSKTSYTLLPAGEPARKVGSTDLLLTNGVPNNFDQTEVVGKTGHINESGYNFAVRLRRPPYQAVRIVVFGAISNELRFSEARDVGTWVFEHYIWPGEEGYQTVAAQQEK